MKKSLLFMCLIALSSSVFAEEYSADRADRPEPIGFYSDGSLRNGVRLPDEGPGFMKLFLERNRNYGTQEILDLITKTTAAMDKKFPNTDRLQVGDVAKEGGGLMSDLHASHQNGLDVDVTYYRRNHVEQDIAHTNGFAEVMVIKDTRISKNFDTGRIWEFLKKLHQNGRVQRIFMDPVIKKELCRYATLLNETKQYTEVLRSLRPYPGHQDHMHIRLRCPTDAKECRAQEEVPPGTGCAKR
jgi:penicillin-insensitive murein endopeptidase